MAAATFDLVGQNVIEQNSYWSIILQFAGNIEGAPCRGQIRKSPGSDLVADFRFDVPLWNSTSQRTVWRMYLTANQTRLIALPPDGEQWFYDVLIQPLGQEQFRLLQGRVSVSPGVTQ